jgi:all-trans-retinol dehydrogenase (NAD+)
MSVALRHASTLLTHSIGQVTLNPVVTAALLWILTKGPVGLRRKITYLQDPLRLEKVVKALKWCLALGVTRVVNNKLNDVALNGGRWKDEKKRWNWNNEVAVVTGGCSGIGGLVVKRLVNKGIKVAVLDIQELPASLQGCKSSTISTKTQQNLTTPSRRPHQILPLRYH